MGAPWLPLLGWGLSVLAIVLYVVSTATESWAVTQLVSFIGSTSSSRSIGLWRSCATSSGLNFCLSLGIDGVTAAVHFTRFATVTSVLILAASLTVPPLVYFKKLDKKFGKVASCLTLGTGILFSLGTIAFAVWQSDAYPGYRFGYSIILAWLSVPLALIGGALILIGVTKTPVEFLGQDMSLA